MGHEMTPVCVFFSVQIPIADFLSPLCQQLHPVVMAMHGVEDSLGLQLIAELGDMTHCTCRNAISAFAGVEGPTSLAHTKPAVSGIRNAAFWNDKNPISGHGLFAKDTTTEQPSLPLHG